MNVLARFVGFGATPARTPSTKVSIVDRDPVVAALVERCGRITPDEADRLTWEWQAIERDTRISADMASGRDQAGPDAAEAADAADWAFRWTLGIASDGASYADNDPFAGRAIQAIRIHAMAVAARDRISPVLAATMSGPWHAAIDPE